MSQPNRIEEDLSTLITPQVQRNSWVGKLKCQKEGGYSNRLLPNQLGRSPVSTKHTLTYSNKRSSEWFIEHSSGREIIPQLTPVNLPRVWYLEVQPQPLEHREMAKERKSPSKENRLEQEACVDATSGNHSFLDSLLDL